MQEDVMKQKVQGSTAHPVLLKIVCFLMIIIGFELVYTGIRENMDIKYFNENGIRIQGTLTKVKETEDGDYYGLYDYIVDGKTYKTASDIYFDFEDEVPMYSNFWYHPDNIHKVRFGQLEIGENLVEIIAGAFLALMGILFFFVFVFHISNRVASLITGLSFVVLGFGTPIAVGLEILLNPIILIALIVLGLIGILLIVRGTLSLLGKEEAFKKLDKKSGDVMMDLLLKFIDIAGGRK